MKMRLTEATRARRRRPSPSELPAPREAETARAAQLPAPPATVELVPRLTGQGYGPEQVAQRRSWVEERTGAQFDHVAGRPLAGEAMRGNVENPIGCAQMPLGVAGPLRVRGEHAQGTYYVPLATTEGALVRSYERGMVALTRAGGAVARIYRDENRVSPIFDFESVEAAFDFVADLPDYFDSLRTEAEATTRHGRLLRVESQPVGRQVIVSFYYSTADAQGMNMIVKATERACRWLAAEAGVSSCYVFSGYNGEKRAAGSLLAGGKGKKVVAGALLPRRLVKTFFRVTPERFSHLWRRTVVGHLATGAIGYNGHYANGLTALFIACGQDVANVANSALGITQFEVTAEGDLYASVMLPSLSIATVGGGTGLGSSRECLQALGCAGTGGVGKLAEITAATLLAGELSFGGAIASGEIVAAHEQYGRNRPQAVEGQETDADQGDKGAGS